MDNVALFHLLIYVCGLIGLVATLSSIFYFNVILFVQFLLIHCIIAVSIK
jgi:hypothetical protein